MPVDADIELAAFDAIEREPVDEIRIGGAAQPRQQRHPGGDGLAAQPQPGGGPFDAGAAGHVAPVGRFGEDRQQPRLQRRHRPG